MRVSASQEQWPPEALAWQLDEQLLRGEQLLAAQVIGTPHAPHPRPIPIEAAAVVPILRGGGAWGCAGSDAREAAAHHVWRAIIWVRMGEPAPAAGGVREQAIL